MPQLLIEKAERVYSHPADHTPLEVELAKALLEAHDRIAEDDASFATYKAKVHKLADNVTRAFRLINEYQSVSSSLLHAYEEQLSTTKIRIAKERAAQAMRSTH